MTTVPELVYGVIQKDEPESEADEMAEQIKRLGYAILDGGYPQEAIERFAGAFDAAHGRYIRKWGEQYLRERDEYHTIRALLSDGAPEFLELASNSRLLALIKRLIRGKFMLNQQNGVINPAIGAYNQGAWHRDLPYQHFVSDTPLAINALFCVDNFTSENGATLVLPASHRVPNFPSPSYIRDNALRIEAKAGQFIVLDCMTFHCGGVNETTKDRRAINQVYSIPYLSPQINLRSIADELGLTEEQKDLLGSNFQTPDTVMEYLERRPRNISID